jgi:hypothetical protein
VKDRLLIQLESYMNQLNDVVDCTKTGWRTWSWEEFVVRHCLSFDNLKRTVARSQHRDELVNLDHFMQAFRSPRI